MVTKTKLFKFQVRRGLASDWVTKNPVLSSGEIGFESNTGLFKIGDGYTPWNSRPHYRHEDATSILIEAGILTKVGDLADLTTNEKGTVVGAINEVDTPPIVLAYLYENAKAG